MCFFLLTLPLTDFLLKTTKHTLVGIDRLLCLIGTYNEFFYVPLCLLMVNNFPSLTIQYWLALCMKMISHMYMSGLPNMTLHTSRGTTSNSTSSIKLSLMENPILHCFVIFKFASLFIFPSGYGHG